MASSSSPSLFSSPYGTLWKGAAASQAQSVSLSSAPFSSASASRKLLNEAAAGTAATTTSSTTTHYVSVGIRNGSQHSLTLCWIDEEGKPHHFYELPPWGTLKKDNPANRTQVPWGTHVHDHIEKVEYGDVLAVCHTTDLDTCKELQSLNGVDGVTWIAAYRPDQPPPSSNNNNNNNMIRNSNPNMKKPPNHSKGEEVFEQLIHWLLITERDIPHKKDHNDKSKKNNSNSCCFCLPFGSSSSSSQDIKDPLLVSLKGNANGDDPAEDKLEQSLALLDCTVELGSMTATALLSLEHPEPPLTLSMSFSSLGRLWLGPVEPVSHLANSIQIHKKEHDRPLHLCFRNGTSQTLTLCWLSDQGKPHHFYELPPWKPSLLPPSSQQQQQTMQPASWTIETAPLSSTDRTERSRTGHAFVIANCPDPRVAKRKQSLQDATWVAAYRPECVLPPPPDTRTSLSSIMVQNNRLFRGQPEGGAVHLVIIQEEEQNKEDEHKGKNGHLRKKKQVKPSPSPIVLWNCQVQVRFSDLVDTTGKVYYKTKIAGWPCYVEENWHGGDEELRQIFEEDLRHCVEDVLPMAAVLELRKLQTPVWLNRQFSFGPKIRPERGIGMRFHPSETWIRQHKMHPGKAASVELYDAPHYKKTRVHWGVGGVLVHEFSHAYHAKCCRDGYNNTDILECYEAAMEEGLYENVQVHGPQGPMARAYACTNAMEYFAELSTAFLGGTIHAETHDYNKWYPFNRKQIRQHDPRAYELLKRIWRIEDHDANYDYDYDDHD